jgi:SAM-dependent methyltransferase
LTALAEKLKDRYFRDEEHPYRLFERTVRGLLRPEHALLDVGCGSTAPVLRKFREACDRLVGIDMVDLDVEIPGIEFYRGDLARIPLPAASVDVIMARSVMEHIEDPAPAYRELVRVLRPGGRLVFLTPNLWDYASLAACVIPNRWHASLVAKMEGRDEEDVFPTHFKTNTFGAVKRWCHESGFELESFQYLGQYPAYFMFNGFLFILGTGYEKLISRFEWLRFLRGWIFVTLRKPGR